MTVGNVLVYKSNSLYDKNMQEFEFKLPKKLNTQNFYGLPYTERDKIALEWAIIISKALDKGKVEHLPCAPPTALTFDFYLRGEPLSANDCGAMVDIIIKALLQRKVFRSDSSVAISQITIIPNKSKRQSSYCVVELD